MKFRLLILVPALLCTSMAFASSAKLKINDWSRFMGAHDGEFIQNGDLVNIRKMNYSEPSCSTIGLNISGTEFVGTLSFYQKKTESGVLYVGEFKYSADMGEVLDLHCTSPSGPMNIQQIQKALGDISDLE